MKKIEAIIRTSKFDAVRDALASIDVLFFSLHEIRGYGLQRGKKQTYRGADLGSDYISRLQMNLVVEDHYVEKIIRTIEHSGKTGEVGDGKIFVYDVVEAVRIRNGERGESAI